ncbi:thermonuclease family protein [Methylobacterium sp. J-077]|uniref:thermonuclease family protein n=1 Tax=Methylobacterium sp. J-077 TaxID=2836656 RepID=UPI001FBA073A|nr:nuclease [Methylobacterium sp. J-077]MCJ2125500.1 nuclease [Methylobacterium sp. J-077]
MTSSTVAAEQGAGPARPALDDPERAALREAIRAAIARARPRPVAVRTLELMAEAAIVSGAYGYRVLDRHGVLRMRSGTSEPMTLADFVAELQARHPALFLPAEPEPAPVPAAEEAKDSPILTGAYEMKAATARFVGRSTEQGRALAQNAAGRFGTLRTGLRARFGRPAGEIAAPERGPDPVAAWNAGPGRLGGAVRDSLRAQLGFGGAVGDESGRHRRWLVGASAAALVAVVAAGLVLAGREPESSRPAATQPQAANAPTAAPANPSATPPTASLAAPPDTVTPPPETGGDPETDTPPPAANAIIGPAQVVDTATLKVGGKVVHLFGVEWVRGGQAEELARYIGGRTVTCQPAPGSDSMNCLVNGRDLSEVVLFNGGGRASPEASPELVAAEDHARSERLGVWKR